jgi:hypothetical protein
MALWALTLASALVLDHRLPAAPRAAAARASAPPQTIAIAQQHSSRVAAARMCADGDEPAKKGEEPISPAMKMIADIASLIATASYQTIGVFFGIGLCLNICGFGYRMTTTEIGIPTVEVKPLAEMRKEIRDERWKAQFMADEIPGL